MKYNGKKRKYFLPLSLSLFLIITHTNTPDFYLLEKNNNLKEGSRIKRKKERKGS